MLQPFASSCLRLATPCSKLSDPLCTAELQPWKPRKSRSSGKRPAVPNIRGLEFRPSCWAAPNPATTKSQHPMSNHGIPKSPLSLSSKLSETAFVQVALQHPEMADFLCPLGGQADGGSVCAEPTSGCLSMNDGKWGLNRIASEAETQLMHTSQDPVTALDGFNYERGAIRLWLETHEVPVEIASPVSCALNPKPLNPKNPKP